MKKSIFALAAIVVIVLSGMAVCSALLPSNESVSSNESLPSNMSTSLPATAQYYQPLPPPDGEPYPPVGPPTYPPEPYPTWTPTPTLTPTPTPSEGHPATIPSYAEYDVPKTPPEAFAGLPAPSPEEETGMQPISAPEAIGGTPEATLPLTAPGSYYGIPGVNAPYLWILYNGRWVDTPAAVNSGGWTRMLLDNDQTQYIWSCEKYPDGHVVWKRWGYQYPGYRNFWFYGDAVGWHEIAMWGSNSGWSNVIYVYVWGTSPGRFTVNAWSGYSHYNIGSTASIYYSVNKPCYTRVTYLKQNSNVVVRPTRYVSTGTHVDTGTIGYPKGRRTVVVDAWTSGGQYAYDVTSYTVG